MASLEKFKDAAKKFEQKEQWNKAIDAYVKAVEAYEASPDGDDANLALYNKVGDLYQRVGDTANAVAYYERSIDKHAEAGLTNQGIALANKVLRLSPGRTAVYLKLGMLFAKKGFAAEAKQNLLEYADRMQKAGQLEAAFAALKKFAEMSPDQGDIWGVLASRLRAAAKTPDQKEQVERLLAEFESKDRIEKRRSRMSRTQLSADELPPEPKGKSSELVFLDLNEAPAARKSTPAAPAPPKAQPAPPPPPPPPAPKPAPPPPPPPPPPPEPEPEPVPEPELPPVAEAEPEPPPPPPQPEPEPEPEPEPVEEVPQLEIESSAAFGAEEAQVSEEPMLGIEPTAFGTEPAAAPPQEDFKIERLSFGEMPALPEGFDDQVEPAATSLPDTGEGADLGMIDLDVGGISAGEAPAAAGVQGLDQGEAPEGEAPPADFELMDLGIAEPEMPAPLTVEELEARLATDPQDWEARRLLGEALLEQGERERGLAELEASAEGYDQAGDLGTAFTLIEEMLRADPNSIKYQQKRVELAYRQGDKAALADAYVELADALLRSNDVEKALAVYQRVVEHDPDNVRARSAIETLTPPPSAKPAAPPKKAAAAAAPAAPAAGDFVDLGAMLLDDEPAGRIMDTRMRIQDEEPSGDEEKDFQSMLSAFKKGIEANVAEEDFESHYDLGVAYKEMGLVDEAIAEFQKALRAPDGKLKSSEALGLCFFEKGQFAVAETIMRRGLDMPAHDDRERIGLLYWLGRALEEQRKYPEALVAYNRVFAVDIRFADVAERVKAVQGAEV